MTRTCSRGVSWAEFQRVRPDLAAAGGRLLYQFGVGLAYLGTVGVDGGPRVHPICPLLTDDALLAFLQPSPKRDDLHRDGRYALHAFPPADNEDAFYLTGRAVPVVNPDRRQAAVAQFVAERGLTGEPDDLGASELFEFGVGRCLWTQTSGHGDWSPNHTVWRSD